MAGTPRTGFPTHLSFYSCPALRWFALFALRCLYRFCIYVHVWFWVAVTVAVGFSLPVTPCPYLRLFALRSSYVDCTLLHWLIPILHIPHVYSSFVSPDACLRTLPLPVDGPPPAHHAAHHHILHTTYRFFYLVHGCLHHLRLIPTPLPHDRLFTAAISAHTHTATLIGLDSYLDPHYHTFHAHYVYSPRIHLRSLPFVTLPFTRCSVTHTFHIHSYVVDSRLPGLPTPLPRFPVLVGV